MLDLQEQDIRLTQVDHRRATLPQVAELTQLEERCTRTRDQRVAAETIVGDLERDLERAEADVEQVRERERRDQHLLDSGSIGDPKQLQSLQHELTSLARRKSELEDSELEVMERVEGAQAAVRQLSGEFDELEQARVALATQVDELVAAIAQERAEVQAERERIASSIPPELLKLYERVRAESAGVGAAHLHRGRCEGCRLQLPPNEIERLRSVPAEEVVRCEECRRILVRTSESGL